MAVRTVLLISGDDGDSWAASDEDAGAPMPVEMIRYGDLSPVFAAAADPNTIKRWTGAWETFSDPLLAGGGVANIASLAYDLVSDRLFVSYIGLKTIFSLKDASVADSAQANSAVADASSILDEGVPGYWVILPDTDEPPTSYRQIVSNKKARP